MSRVHMYGALVAAAAVSLMVSCRSGARVGLVRSKSPVFVNFSCEGGNNTISLTDNAGNPAWEVDTDHRKISWRVRNNDSRVTINAIAAKPGKDLPIEDDGPNHGGSGGRPFDAKVKSKQDGGPDDGTTLYYNITVTCQPSSGNPVKLIIDPEMIVR